MVAGLMAIEGARQVVDLLPLPPDAALAMRHAARQSATRNSTAIEGNTLNDRQIRQALVSSEPPQNEMEQEVRNYWRALEWIEAQLEAGQVIAEDFIQQLHCIILVRGTGRRGTRSAYRTTECPVVDAATGHIDYAPPIPKHVPELMTDLVRWLHSKEATSLPGPIRAGLLAHRFVSIHPFTDGNGRTTRALATTELWRSGYDLRGFLSLEEHYEQNRNAYYANLQMGLPSNYYEGRHDPDHTPWLEYFVATMARAAEAVRAKAVTFNQGAFARELPWERLSRTQQQLLSRLYMRGLDNRAADLSFTPGDVAEWYGISDATAREWLGEWRANEYVRPQREGERVRKYLLNDEWAALVSHAINARLNEG